MQKIPFLQMPRWVPFKKYRANHLEEICNQQDRAKQQLKALDVCTKIDWLVAWRHLNLPLHVV